MNQRVNIVEQYVGLNKTALIREENKHSLHNKLYFKTISVALIMSDISNLPGNANEVTKWLHATISHYQSESTFARKRQTVQTAELLGFIFKP